MTTVVDLNRKNRKRKRAPRDLVRVDQNSGPGKFFAKMVRDIESDLGGRRQTTRVAGELIEAFAGCATALRYQTHQILLGDAELDLTGYATLASTMLRIGSRLGFERRARDVTPTLSDLLSQDQAEQRRRRAEEQADEPP
jgi:hypothetical protein